MSRDQDSILIEAMRWHAAAQEDAMDWDGFAAWLDADSRHREAYDTVALGDALLEEHGEALRASLDAAMLANDDEDAAPAPLRARRSWMAWSGAAIAASLVAMLALPQLLVTPEAVYATGATSRTIALADGSAVTLAPHSKLAILGRQQQRMTLSGGAWFDIRHDPSRALEITAGGVRIDDIGTRFDVQETAGQVRVEVAEGVVDIRAVALGQPIRLTQGRSFHYDPTQGKVTVQGLDQDAIGEWRSGRLSFDATPLALVAADLSRYAGVEVTVVPGLRDRRFSGTLVIGNGEAALRDLSQVMGVELRRGPSGLVLDERR
jgi:transmembrane sensor